MRLSTVFAALVLFGVSACSKFHEADGAEMDAQGPTGMAVEFSAVPEMRWDHRPEAATWTTETMDTILFGHGQALTSVVPRDINEWCPAYPNNGTEKRAAFWVGLLSAMAKHESTWNPAAVGGGSKWFGLVQVSPGTARGYGCRAQSGQALKNGVDNLSCAVRIMAVTVPRDQVVSEGFRGVAADWGPFHSARKRADMKAWTTQQGYCQ